MKEHHAAVGYLPEERPSFIKLLLYAIQQVIVMFPATVTVALVTGFQVSTTIFASGLATLCFILITGRKIPLYYGSSFAYLTAIASMCAAEGFEKVDGILPTEAIQYAQFGIIFSGLISIAAGLLVREAAGGGVLGGQHLFRSLSVIGLLVHKGPSFPLNFAAEGRKKDLPPADAMRQPPKSLVTAAGAYRQAGDRP